MNRVRTSEVHLNYAAIGRILKYNCRTLVDETADAIARDVDTHSVEKRPGDGAQSASLVIVDRYTTDRAAAAVIVAHPAGVALEAKHGSLTRAAARNGHTVRNTKRIL